MQLPSYLENGPLMWMMPLHLHVNQKSDYKLYIYSYLVELEAYALAGVFIYVLTISVRGAKAMARLWVIGLLVSKKILKAFYHIKFELNWPRTIKGKDVLNCWWMEGHMTEDGVIGIYYYLTHKHSGHGAIKHIYSAVI